MQQLIVRILSDNYIIMYNFYRWMRRSDPPKKAIAYAEEFSAYLLALSLFALVFVPIGALMAYLKVSFSVTRYLLIACILVAIVVAKKRATEMLKKLDTEDKALRESYCELTKGRWMAWLIYWCAPMILAIALGYYYSDIARH